eukprot:182877-Chlamydomonas_euryale.AAC.10
MAAIASCAHICPDNVLISCNASFHDATQPVASELVWSVFSAGMKGSVVPDKHVCSSIVRPSARCLNQHQHWQHAAGVYQTHSRLLSELRCLHQRWQHVAMRVQAVIRLYHHPVCDHDRQVPRCRHAARYGSASTTSPNR